MLLLLFNIASISTPLGYVQDVEGLLDGGELACWHRAIGIACDVTDPKQLVTAVHHMSMQILRKQKIIVYIVL